MTGFAMLERDSVTGLNLAVHREENPTIGRWDSKDPLGFAAADANLFRYAESDPVAHSDPTGLIDDQYGHPITGSSRPGPPPGVLDWFWTWWDGPAKPPAPPIVVIPPTPVNPPTVVINWGPVEIWTDGPPDGGTVTVVPPGEKIPPEDPKPPGPSRVVLICEEAPFPISINTPVRIIVKPGTRIQIGPTTIIITRPGKPPSTYPRIPLLPPIRVPVPKSN